MRRCLVTSNYHVKLNFNLIAIRYKWKYLDRKEISLNKDTGERGSHRSFAAYSATRVVIAVSIPSIFMSVINCIDNGAVEGRADEKNRHAQTRPWNRARWSEEISFHIRIRDQASFRKDRVIDIQRVCDSNGMQELFSWETNYRSKARR